MAGSKYLWNHCSSVYAVAAVCKIESEPKLQTKPYPCTCARPQVFGLGNWYDAPLWVSFGGGSVLEHVMKVKKLGHLQDSIQALIPSPSLKIQHRVSQ